MNNNTRRHFLKKAGITGIAAFTLPNALSSEAVAEYIQKSEIKKPSSQNLTFLFQGDSITDGNRARDNDWNHIMGHGYAYLIASRLWYDNTDKGLMFINRGVSGNKVSDLAARWQTDTLDCKPDVLSILIGINDVLAIIKNWSTPTIDGFRSTYTQLLEQTRKVLPDTLIVLCEPFMLPLGWTLEKPEIWKAELEPRRQIVRELADQFKTLFINLQQPFIEACRRAPAKYWIWDGVHPMPAGHELIAREWLSVVKNSLPFFNIK
jgi:lysophospholipase L1-like esterase